MVPSPRKEMCDETPMLEVEVEDQPSRDDRLQKHKMQCDSLVMYLTTNKCPESFTKNEIRNLRNQAKTHMWDSKRQELVYVGSKKNVRKKVVTELNEIKDILHQYHSNPMGGHSGINNTLSKISNYYIWSGMKEDVVEYCKSCDRCQRHGKLKTMAPELKCIKVNKAMELVGMDLIGPLPTTPEGYKYVLTFTDYYTKFVDFYPLKEKAAAGVARCIKTFVCRWGAPCRLLSDQGREFVAKVNAQICEKFGISRSVTSAYHPQTNGLDERTNQTLKVRLSKLVNEHQDNWDEYLEEIAFSIRTQKQSSTKYSPFFLMFGRHARTPMEMEEPSETQGEIKMEDPCAEELEEMVANRTDMMNNVGKEVEENTKKAQEKQKKEYEKKKNKRVKVFNLSPGDIAYRKCMKNVARKGGKMDAIWTGPYRIIEIDQHQRVQLAHIKSGEMLKVKVPYDQLRPHVTSELHQPQTQTSNQQPPPLDSLSSTANHTATTTDLSILNTDHLASTDHFPPKKNQPATGHATSAQAPPSSTDHASSQAPPSTTDHLTQAQSSTTDYPATNHSTQALPPTKVQPASTADHFPPKHGQPDKTQEIILVAEIKKKRKVGPIPVKLPATHKNQLLGSMNDEILNGQWLSDAHIDHAQAMLAHQYPTIGGWQACGVFVPDGCQCVGTPEGDFVQILNVEGDHWITVSNIGCQTDTIRVYDSLYKDVGSSAKQKFLKQVAYILMPKSKVMTLEWADTQRQIGSSDCGLFAIAVATSLCSGMSPQECTWDQEQMRDHLVNCFVEGSLTTFPQSEKVRNHQGLNRHEDVRVYCHCRQPFNQNTFMVQCDCCLEWYHRGCQRIPRLITEDMPFFCKKCKRR